MRIAVLMTGVIRIPNEKTKEVLDTLNTMLAAYDHDIYIHTWNPCQGDPSFTKALYIYDKPSFDTCIRAVPHVKEIIYEDAKTQEELDQIDFPYTQFVVKNMQYAMSRNSVYNTFTALRSLCHHVKDTGIPYDILLRVRCDILFAFSDIEQVLHEVQKGALCMPPNFWCGDTYINDHICIGLYSTLISVLDYGDLEYFKHIVRHSWNQEQVTQKLMERANCPFVQVPVKHYVKLLDHTIYV